MSEAITLENASRLTERGQARCGFITEVVWSRDRLALAHGGGLWVWEGGFGGAAPRAMVGHIAPVKGVAFSPDGQVLASASADTTVRLWMAETGQPLHVVRTNTGAVNAVAFSLNGRLLASAGGDRRVHIFDMMESTGSVMLDGHTNEITSLTFGSDHLLASGGWDNTVHLWSVSEHQERAILPFDDWIRDLAVNPDGKILAAACKNGTVRLIDFATGETIRTIQAHEGGADTAAFSPDETLLVTGGRDNALKLWNAASGDLLATLTGHTKPVLTVAFHPGGALLASGSGDNSVRLWGIADMP